MSEDTIGCNCGPDPVCVDETTSPAQVVDEEDLLKMMEEKNKSVIYCIKNIKYLHTRGSTRVWLSISIFYKIRFGTLRLRDTHELILWALIFIVLKSSLIVFCIEWSGYHLQSTV